MSMNNTTENATLKMHLQGTDPSYRANPTQYLALFTADPGEAEAWQQKRTTQDTLVFRLRRLVPGRTPAVPLQTRPLSNLVRVRQATTHLPTSR